MSRVFHGIPQWNLSWYPTGLWSQKTIQRTREFARSSVRQKEVPLRCAVASIDQVEVDMRTP